MCALTSLFGASCNAGHHDAEGLHRRQWVLKVKAEVTALRLPELKHLTEVKGKEEVQLYRHLPIKHITTFIHQTVTCGVVLLNPHHSSQSIQDSPRERRRDDVRGVWQRWGCPQLCLRTEHEPTGRFDMAVGGEGEELGRCQETFQEPNHITTVLQVRSELDMNIKSRTRKIVVPITSV